MGKFVRFVYINVFILYLLLYIKNKIHCIGKDKLCWLAWEGLILAWGPILLTTSVDNIALWALLIEMYILNILVLLWWTVLQVIDTSLSMWIGWTFYHKHEHIYCRYFFCLIIIVITFMVQITVSHQATFLLLRPNYRNDLCLFW